MVLSEMSQPVNEHTEARLDTLEKFAVSTDNRLVNVEKTLSGMTADLRTVVQAVTTVTARPVWDVAKLLDIGLKGGGLAVLVAGLITYIASNINAPAMREAQLRTEFLQLRLDNGWFRASGMVIRAPGGQVGP